MHGIWYLSVCFFLKDATFSIHLSKWAPKMYFKYIQNNDDYSDRYRLNFVIILSDIIRFESKIWLLMQIHMHIKIEWCFECRKYEFSLLGCSDDIPMRMPKICQMAKMQIQNKVSYVFLQFYLETFFLSNFYPSLIYICGILFLVVHGIEIEFVILLVDVVSSKSSLYCCRIRFLISEKQNSSNKIITTILKYIIFLYYYYYIFVLYLESRAQWKIKQTSMCINYILSSSLLLLYSTFDCLNCDPSRTFEIIYIYISYAISNRNNCAVISYIVSLYGIYI